MSNKRRVPKGFTEPQEEKACLTCKIYAKCGLLKEANRLAKVSGNKEEQDDFFYCYYYESDDEK